MNLRAFPVGWHIAVVSLPPRIAPFSHELSIVAHADAHGSGRIAAVYGYPTSNYAARLLPAWLFELDVVNTDESPIFLSEWRAVILMTCVLDEFADKACSVCALCVDNQTAVAAIGTGSSTSRLGTVLVWLCWNLAVCKNAHWRAQYVSAKADSSDYPSRAWSGNALTRTATIGAIHARFLETPSHGAQSTPIH